MLKIDSLAAVGRITAQTDLELVGLNSAFPSGPRALGRVASLIRSLREPIAPDVVLYSAPAPMQHRPPRPAAYEPSIPKSVQPDAACRVASALSVRRSKARTWVLVARAALRRAQNAGEGAREDALAQGRTIFAVGPADASGLSWRGTICLVRRYHRRLLVTQSAFTLLRRATSNCRQLCAPWCSGPGAIHWVYWRPSGELINGRPRTIPVAAYEPTAARPLLSTPR